MSENLAIANQALNEIADQLYRYLLNATKVFNRFLSRIKRGLSETDRILIYSVYDAIQEEIKKIYRQIKSKINF